MDGSAVATSGPMWHLVLQWVSPTIARVADRGSFVAMLVVARDTRHQLLRIRRKALFHFVHKVEGVAAAKRCGDSTMVQNLDVSVLALAMRKTEISFK
jgi:hypothetical protein